jgi:hypothetical protein
MIVNEDTSERNSSTIRILSMMIDDYDDIIVGDERLILSGLSI